MRKETEVSIPQKYSYTRVYYGTIYNTQVTDQLRYRNLETWYPVGGAVWKRL